MGSALSEQSVLIQASTKAPCKMPFVATPVTEMVLAVGGVLLSADDELSLLLLQPAMAIAVESNARGNALCIREGDFNMGKTPFSFRYYCRLRRRQPISVSIDEVFKKTMSGQLSFPDLLALRFA